MLYESLHYILGVCQEHQRQREEATSRDYAAQRRRNSSQDSQGNESAKEEGWLQYL